MPKTTDLISLLKKLQGIEADPQYVRRSREFIVGVPLEARPTVWQVFTRGIQSGSALALVGVFVILLFGGFSTWRFLSPFQISSLDPASLHAEAQAIDIQIQLTNVGYQEPAPSNSTLPVDHAQAVKKLAENLSVNPTNATSSPTSTPPLSIDQALEKLGGE